MEEMDYWRLCDELSVYQAAFLILGLNPADYPYKMHYLEQAMIENFPAVIAAPYLVGRVIFSGRTH